MTSGPKNLYRVAHVEDAAEESGDCMVGKPGTRKYATRATPVTPVPQSKANTSKSRSDKRPIAPPTLPASADLVPEPQGAAEEDDALRDEGRPSEEDCDEVDARARDRAERRRERKLRDDKKEAQTKAAVASTRDDTRAQRLHRPTTLKQSYTQPLPTPSYRRGSTDEMPIYAFPQPNTSAPGPGFDPTSGSYFDGQQFRPVPINMVWHPPRQVSVPFPSPSFSPYQAWNGYGAPPGGYMPPSSLPPPDGYAPGYFDGMPGPIPQPQLHLHQRLDRRGPGMGYARPPPSYYDPGQADYWADAPLAPSIKRRPMPKLQPQSQPAEDSRKKMPPPDAVPSKASRPKTPLPSSSSSSARPSSHHGHSKPRDSHRRSVHAANKRGDDSLGIPEQDHDAYSPDGEEFDDDDDEEYQDPAPKTRRGSTNHHHHHHRRHHQQQPQHEPEPRTTPSIRKHRPPPHDSHAPTPPPLCPSGLGPKHEKKYYDALAYQEKVSRRPSPFAQVPLTAEHLRKVGRRGEGPSSHSTRSSRNSRGGEESSHKRSSGTRTSRTQSGGGGGGGVGEDLRIKISGGARLRVSGAEIDCGDNAEIVFAGPRSRGGGGGSSSGSARMVEDLRSRRGEREREKVLPRRQRGGSPGEWSTQGGGSRERSSRGSR
ncbi:hypothetical protein E4U57_000550 [Claviceps arundinis]|uniref:Uncharacterized protein n=1 Tax=Claviceps arundinis TaxID=1623583 RepID=A0ABQ7PCH5_9HYPO|nr:hypothetical protein E4U57_000550 [Claviceps arundinis]